MEQNSFAFPRTSTLPSSTETFLVTNPSHENDVSHLHKTVSGKEKVGSTSGQIDDRRVLLAITVEIEDGWMELISLREGDSPEEVATKFCKDHFISDRFVSPLTEHIVSNLKEISIETTSTSGYQSSAGAAESMLQCEIRSNSTSEEFSGPTTGHSHLHNQTIISEPKKQPNVCEHKLCSLRSLQKERKKVQRRKHTTHHVIPSFASVARSQRELPKDKKMEVHRSSQLSERAKAVYMRLYMEFLKQKQRLEEEKRQSLEQYQERLARNKPSYSKSMESKLMECTFKPQINRAMHADGDSSVDRNSRFDQLFWDAENRRRRQAEYTQWYPEGVTFRPLINKQCQLGSMSGQPNEHSVFDRLLQYASKINEKKQKWQENQARLIDPTTGQEFFRPLTGRKPQHERNGEALPIGDFLYQLKFSLENKRRSLVDRDLQRAKELANCNYVSHKSSQLLENLKERNLQQIFAYLDSDKDGYVDLNTAVTKQLCDDVVDDIEKVKNLGPASQKQLSFEKFVTLMMDVQKKRKKSVHLVLKPCKKHLLPEKFPFQFKMNCHSRNLASGQRRFRNSRQWYRLLLFDRERRQSKIEAMRKERQSQELAECTFRPSIHGKMCKAQGRFISGTPIHHKSLSPESSIMEKEQQEMHGFIFQEANLQCPESPTAVDVASPLSLLESLKRIVSKSAENRGETSASREVQGSDICLSTVPDV